MKSITSIFVVLLPLLLYSQQQTDAREYGFQGDIVGIIGMKSMHVPRINDQWQFDSASEDQIFLIELDEQGNFIKLLQTEFVSGGRELIQYSFEFKDGLRSGAYGINSELDTVIRHEIDWVGPRSYVLNAVRFDTITNVFRADLNRHFRDSAGSSNYFVNDVLVISEEYTNHFDENGNMVGSEYHDHITGEKFFLKNMVLERDDYGNITKVAIVRLETHEVEGYMVRRFVYRPEDLQEPIEFKYRRPPLPLVGDAMLLGR